MMYLLYSADRYGLHGLGMDRSLPREGIAGLIRLAGLPIGNIRSLDATMTLTKNFVKSALLPTALIFSMASAQADEAAYRRASNVLGVALPVVAAGLSVANDDASGLLQLAKSETLTLASVELLKRVTHETRPNGKDDKSFPSGHAAIAFSAAQYMQMRGGWEYGVPAYLAASAVAYSRVQAREHYWKDVLAGAAIGIGSSYFFTDNKDQRSFSMMFSPNSAQLTYSSRW